MTEKTLFQKIMDGELDGEILSNQEVDHIHVHLLGGRALDWPPGQATYDHHLRRLQVSSEQEVVAVPKLKGFSRRMDVLRLPQLMNISLSKRAREKEAKR